MPNTRAMLLMAIALALTPAAQAYERTLTSDGAYLYSFAAGSVMITSTTGDAGFDNSLREIYADGSNVRITGTFELQLVSRDETSERYLTSTALDMLFGLTPTAGGVLSLNAGGVDWQPATPIHLDPGREISVNGVVSGSGGSGSTGGSVFIGTGSGSGGGNVVIGRGGTISVVGSGDIVVGGSGSGTGGVILTLLPPVPEPSSALMLALGGLALAGVIARRRRV